MQACEDLDRSISLYPATVTTFTQEVRPVSPGVEEVQGKLKVNYEGFGFRLEDRMRRHLKSLSDEIEVKMRLSQDLSQEIASRKRVLASLQNSPSGLDDAFLRTQIKARDRQIVLLSDRLFELTARRKWKPGEEAKKLSAAMGPLTAQVEALSGLLRQRDEAISRLLTVENREVARLTSEKETLAAQMANLRLELEEKTSREAVRERMLQETKADLERIRANRPPPDQIDSTRPFQSPEAPVVSSDTQGNQVETLKKEAEKGKALLIACSEVAESLTKQLATLSEDSGQSSALLKEQLQADLHTLQSLCTSVSAPQFKLGSPEALQLELEVARLEITRLETATKEAQSRLDATKMANSAVQEELEKSIAEKVSLIAGLDHEIHSLREEVSSFAPEKQELGLALSQALGQVAALEGKVEDQSSVNASLLGRLEVAEKMVKTSSEHIQDLHQTLQRLDRQNAQLDQTHSRLLLKLRAMEVELWNKDTEMLEREKKTVELLEEMDKLRVDGDQFNARLRKEVAEQLAAITLQLEAKDQEISLLKGMLRSLQSQLKQKDTDLTRIKKKSGEVASPKKQSDLSSPKVGQGEEAREVVETFCWQVGRLRKFADSKKARILAMEAMGGVTPVWLKEELKLAKTPDSALPASEVLRKSVEQRLELQLDRLKAVEDSGAWGFAGELAAQEAVMALPEMQGEQWEGLVNSLRKFGFRVLLAQ